MFTTYLIIVGLDQACPAFDPQASWGLAQLAVQLHSAPSQHGSSSAQQSRPAQHAKPSLSNNQTAVCIWLWAEIRTREERSAVLTQMMTTSCVHFDTLAKYSSVDSKKYAALLSVLIKKFDNRFKDCKKFILFFFFFFFFVYLQLQFQSTEKPDLWIFSWNVELQSGINSKIWLQLFTRLLQGLPCQR